MLNALRTDNSPFSEQQLEALKQSLGTLSEAQSLWLSGYLAGRLAEQEGALSLPTPATGAAPAAVLNILFGSETGNGEALAETLAARFEAAGVRTQLQPLDSFRPAGLKKLEHAVFVMSTHGEGDPPEEAIDLFEFLDSDRAPQLNGLNYRVLALGDRSYSLFCEAGRRLDERLQALGASPFGPRVDCDVDYADDAQAWGDQVLSWARETLRSDTPVPSAARLSVVPATPAWTRERPFEAELLRVQKITGLESDKDVYQRLPDIGERAVH
jgi:sulfite reductase (NADPH) flavoprotein alpha-component